MFGSFQFNNKPYNIFIFPGRSILFDSLIGIFVSQPDLFASYKLVILGCVCLNCSSLFAYLSFKGLDMFPLFSFKLLLIGYMLFLTPLLPIKSHTLGVLSPLLPVKSFTLGMRSLSHVRSIGSGREHCNSVS